MPELTLPLLNHFLRLALGGWDNLPVNDPLIAATILPLVKELDPNEVFWHVEDGFIWKVDPWKAIWRRTQERAKLREEQLIQSDKQKELKELLIVAIQKKLHLPDRQMAERLALEILRDKATEVAREFGVELGEMEGYIPTQVIQEGKVVDEY